MNYLEVYKKRVSHLGETYQEHAFNSGILEFRRYLKYNQHTERNLILTRDESKFDGVILTDKEDENRVSQILLVKLVQDGGPALAPGDLIIWNDEYWIIYRSTTSSYQPHQKFYMVRCNYNIRWLDSKGLIHESWIYLLGSKDSKIKDNFRTWHNAITPQPNKYINIIMPHQLMDLGTEIVVLDEVWYLVDYDQNSVPGVIFMSFTETNLNEQRDSLEEKLANADQKAEWLIDMADNVTVAANSIVELNYTITKNGVVQNVEATISCGEGLELMADGRVKVITGGTITVSCNGVSATQQINIGEETAPEMRFTGSETIRVASENKYTLENAASKKIEFIVDKPEMIKSMRPQGNVCVITANEKNKLGSFKLSVYYDGQLFAEKTINVVSLWQVI